jgi:hypothetical protein
MACRATSGDVPRPSRGTFRSAVSRGRPGRCRLGPVVEAAWLSNRPSSQGTAALRKYPRYQRVRCPTHRRSDAYRRLRAALYGVCGRRVVGPEHPDMSVAWTSAQAGKRCSTIGSAPPASWPQELERPADRAQAAALTGPSATRFSTLGRHVMQTAARGRSAQRLPGRRARTVRRGGHDENRR